MLMTTPVVVVAKNDTPPAVCGESALKASISQLAGVAMLAALAFNALGASPTGAATPVAPSVTRIVDTNSSHAFLAAAHQSEPFDLEAAGYIESEYRLAGRARVFDWPTRDGEAPQVLAEGPYVTRLLIRRPAEPARFNGTVIVEPMNPSTPVDLPIMWAQSHRHFIESGYAWVGITIKPNTIRSLKTFDPARYGELAMPNPSAAPRCAVAQINPSSQPTTTSDESGLAWDIITQTGELLKSRNGTNPLGVAAQRLYMTGQSQTAGYARTWATLFGRRVTGPDGRPLYDAYLYSGSPPWQVPIHQCRADLASGDPRLITPGVRVPVVELFAQGDIGTNVGTRRKDADTRTDRFRRYEVAGAPHFDPWEERSFASDADTRRATGTAAAATDDCKPSGVTPSDFPNRHAMNAAWYNLDRWVRRDIPPPHAPLLELKPQAPGTAFDPATAFVEDAHGNALGGVRTSTVDVPTARWVGAKTGAFRCLFEGYKIPFDEAKLRSLYPDSAAYVTRVKRSAAALEQARWLTPTDAREIVREAEATLSVAGVEAAPSESKQCESGPGHCVCFTFSRNCFIVRAE